MNVCSRASLHDYGTTELVLFHGTRVGIIAEYPSGSRYTFCVKERDSGLYHYIHHSQIVKRICLVDHFTASYSLK